MNEIDLEKRRGSPAKNGAGQRMGHTAAELRRMETLIQSLEREVQRLGSELKIRDQLIASSNNHFADSLIELVKVVASQEAHRSGQNDHVLRQVLDIVKTLDAKASRQRRLALVRYRRRPDA